MSVPATSKYAFDMFDTGTYTEMDISYIFNKSLFLQISLCKNLCIMK
jgi:hypothetical protein